MVRDPLLVCLITRALAALAAVKTIDPLMLAVFRAGWEKTITPLDTCGTVVLDGDRFARLQSSDDPLTRAVLANR